MIAMQIQGAKEIERKLLSLGKKVAKKIVRKAVRAGAKPTHRAAKANAKSYVGGDMGSTLSRNLVLRVKPKKDLKPGEYGVQVKFKPGVDELVHITKVGKRHYIPSAIEYGHAAPGDARGTKTVAPISFFRSAVDANKRRAVGIITREIQKGVNQIARSG